MDDWLRREVGPWFYIERVDWTTHCQALYDRMVALDYRLASEGRIGGEHGRFAYFETEQDPGTMIEHSEDNHTGFDLRRHSWRLRYVPVNLATGPG